MREMVSALINVREVYSNHSSSVLRNTVVYTREVIIAWCRRRRGLQISRAAPSTGLHLR